MRAWTGRNWFLVGLIAAVGAAFVFPSAGADGGVLRAHVTSKSAVSAIFVLQGLILPLEAVRAGLMRWRLHVMVQSWIFVVVPLVGVSLELLFGRFFPDDFRIGFLFLSVLPTTISSAVVLTSLAGGNAAGALVNTTLSNLAGVVLTPLWLAVLLNARGEAPPVGPLVASIAMMILLPFVVGQCLRPVAREFVDRHVQGIRGAASALILFIVYAAFCNSVQSGLWTAYDWRFVVLALAAVVVFFALAFAVVLPGARMFGLEKGDCIAALMCAPQKTLAAGVPMAKLIFATSPALGLILLPVMLYHPLQLLVGGILANRIGQKRNEESG